MSYTLATLWHGRNRFLPGVLAVAFSGLLINVQCGLLMGLLALTAVPVEHSRADVWVGHPEVTGVDLGRPIPLRWESRVASLPEVERTEPYLLAFLLLDKPDGRSSLCTLIGSDLGPDSLGAAPELTPELRARLSEPLSVVADESDVGRLGFRGVGDTAEILGRRVRLVGLVGGMRSLAAPFLFCSLETARLILTEMTNGQTIYVLARCKDPADAPRVVRELRARGDLSAFGGREFAVRT